MKAVLTLFIAICSLNVFADQTAKVSCTLVDQTNIIEKVIYSITVDASPSVPFFMNSKEFSINNLQFYGVALNGSVQTHVNINGSEITSQSGTESSISVTSNGASFAFTCKFQ